MFYIFLIVIHAAKMTHVSCQIIILNNINYPPNAVYFTRLYLNIQHHERILFRLKKKSYHPQNNGD